MGKSQGGKARGELALIERIRTRARARAGTGQARGVWLGIGDDCAILRPPRGHEVVVTTDFSLEGRHFRRDWHTADSAGHRCLARGLSDLAAMGAEPLGAFLSLALPAGYEVGWVDGFLGGLLGLAERVGVTLAGGDTSESPDGSVLADIVLVGSVPRGRALLRSGARVGDRIFVTGALGGAAAELEEMAAGRRGEVGPQSYPEPRLGVGRALRRRRLATAAMDLSDGLSTDLTHLCEASGVRAELRSGAIPVHARAGGRLGLALDGGEDYELLFTAGAETRVPGRIDGVAVTEIGVIAAWDGEARVRMDGKELVAGGWEHLRG